MYKPDPATVNHQKAARNYYAVNSAIMIEENEKMQMIVMNDRSQGGSAFDSNTKDGARVELMINRRVYSSDGLGMPEQLNEHDSNKNGVNVSAKFYLQFTQGRE